MKNILFVCTGNSARSIIAEAIVNNHFKDKYKAYSAGSNPLGKVNEDIKNYLLSKNINLTGYYSKNFRDFLDNRIRMDHVITVCNNANNEVCPIWPKNNHTYNNYMDGLIFLMMFKDKLILAYDLILCVINCILNM